MCSRDAAYFGGRSNTGEMLIRNSLAPNSVPSTRLASRSPITTTLSLSLVCVTHTLFVLSETTMQTIVRLARLFA
jgi:hypothetical protein